MTSVAHPPGKKIKHHLVMTNGLPWKDPPKLFIGKPSISMGHLYHGYVTNDQMVDVQHSQQLPQFGSMVLVY